MANRLSDDVTVLLNQTVVPAVTAPVAPILVRGSTVTITWTGFRGKWVRIQLFQGNNYVRRISDKPAYTANDCSFDWTIPNTVKLGNNYRIKIFADSDPRQNAFSRVFSIVAP